MPGGKSMVDFQAMRNAQRAGGPACILAIGTATPPNVYQQSEYPDYYFRITNSEHKVELKEKFKRMCEKSMIRKRYMYLTEEILKENPNLCAYMAPSLDARQEMAVAEVPRLGKEAALKAIKEWDRSKSELTHLVFASTNGMDMPGADYQLCKLLGLRASVKRVMMYNLGCYAGGTVLRVAKDIAENNRGARVLAVCSEVTAASFRGTSDTHIDCLVGHAIFADGTAAVIVGADPVDEIEKPCFELLWTCQRTLPDCEGTIDGHTREAGLVFHLKEELPRLISDNVEMALVEAFEQFNICNWNELFWVVHPGGRAILDQVESKLRLDPRKMRASREVLREYGNMWSASVLFVLDEMRKSSKENGCVTTGEGVEMGVLLGFGPGLTLETVVLKSVPLPR